MDENFNKISTILARLLCRILMYWDDKTTISKQIHNWIYLDVTNSNE